MGKIIILISFVCWGLIQPASAQDEGYIYGEVTTTSGNKHIGHFRWGNEETFWTDIYNASKLDTRVFGHLIEQQEEEEASDWLGIDWSLSSIWEDVHGYSVHEFSCQFGNIQTIEYQEGKNLHLTLKDRTIIKVGGSGYNDVRASITMYDDEMGKIKIRGSEVARVDFKPTPKKLALKSGNQLYGAVVTWDNDSIVGHIEWDHDEKLDTEILDGSSGGQDLEIKFAKIKRIEPDRGRSYVTLLSGRELVMHGTNDVDESNKGIIVTVEGLGHIDVPWSRVEAVHFFHGRDSSGPSYDDFNKPKGLSGTVQLINGESFSGYMVYDMDEVWEFEMLNAKSHGMDFDIPFSNIKSIKPKNYNFSWIELKAGKKFLLGDTNDVSDDNGGLLLFPTKNEDPIKIRWRDVDEIVFN